MVVPGGSSLQSTVGSDHTPLSVQKQRADTLGSEHETQQLIQENHIQKIFIVPESNAEHYREECKGFFDMNQKMWQYILDQNNQIETWKGNYQASITESAELQQQNAALKQKIKEQAVEMQANKQAIDMLAHQHQNLAMQLHAALQLENQVKALLIRNQELEEHQQMMTLTSGGESVDTPMPDTPVASQMPMPINNQGVPGATLQNNPLTNHQETVPMRNWRVEDIAMQTNENMGPIETDAWEMQGVDPTNGPGETDIVIPVNTSSTSQGVAVVNGQDKANIAMENDEDGQTATQNTPQRVESSDGQGMTDVPMQAHQDLPIDAREMPPQMLGQNEPNVRANALGTQYVNIQANFSPLDQQQHQTEHHGQGQVVDQRRVAQYVGTYTYAEDHLIQIIADCIFSTWS